MGRFTDGYETFRVKNSQKEMKVAEVFLILPLFKKYSYLIPEHLRSKIKRGQLVIVPLKNKLERGFVVEIKETSESLPYKLKEIAYVPEIKPLKENMIKLGLEISRFFITPPGMALNLFSQKIPMGFSHIFKITPKGREILEKSKKSKFEFKVLSFIEKNGETPLSKLEKNFSGAVYSAIKKLLRENLIERNTLFYKKGERRGKKYCELLKLPENYEKISEKQKKILEQLLNVGAPVPLSFLQNTLKVSISPINTLQKKGYIKIFHNREEISPFSNLRPIKQEKLKMNEAQRKVFERVVRKIKENRGEKFLLFGVTGSGKTLVYIKLIEECLKLGKSAIMLVPEISLTPQMAGKFYFYFGDKMALFHSMLSESERREMYERVKNGKAKVILGTRSALFMDVKDPGIIIIDEEHDSSYIQENAPNYNAIWVAEKICEEKNIPLLLGSATPSITSFFRTKSGDLKLLEMRERVEKRKLPEVEIIDMSREFEKYGRGIIVSGKLKNSIRETLERGEQVILLLNRRGFAPIVLCRKCGYVVTCKNCNISMTFHKRENRMICHYCGYFKEKPDVCPQCGSKYIYLWGIGTEKVEESLKRVFNNFKIARFDRDTTRKKGSMEKILKDFKNKRIDLLIGTQMIAKGHDFPNVTLVGVLSADMMLKIPFFDSSEKTFQLLTQVAGRSGRGKKGGRVIIQTYYPDHYAIKFSRSHDYISFYEREIEYRKKLFYPPFSNLIQISIYHKKKTTSLKLAEKTVNMLENIVEDLEGEDFIRILGPVESERDKIKNMYIHTVLIRILKKELHTKFTTKIVEEIMKRDITLSKNLRFETFF